MHLLDDILDPALVKVFELLEEGRVAAESSGNGAGSALFSYKLTALSIMVQCHMLQLSRW